MLEKRGIRGYSRSRLVRLPRDRGPVLQLKTITEE